MVLPENAYMLRLLARFFSSNHQLREIIGLWYFVENHILFGQVILLTVHCWSSICCLDVPRNVG